MPSNAAAGTQQPRVPEKLTEESLARGVSALSRIDPDLARVAREYGTPPMWEREPGFPMLVLIILEQQVSLASAGAAFRRLVEASLPLTPESFLAHDDAALRRFGFSRQKALYSRLVARAVASGELDFGALDRLDDEEARATLKRLKGVGPWTVEIYLLRAMLRPDAWPAGDLALQFAAREVKRLSERPTTAELERLGELWRPWRSVAARLLWQHYLMRPKPAPPRPTSELKAEVERANSRPDLKSRAG